MKNNKDKIKEFIEQVYPNIDLNEEQDIFSSGIVNSLFAMQLVLFIEKEFNITLENEDLDFDNLKSIRSINDLIERKHFNMSGGVI